MAHEISVLVLLIVIVSFHLILVNAQPNVNLVCRGISPEGFNVPIAEPVNELIAECLLDDQDEEYDCRDYNRNGICGCFNGACDENECIYGVLPYGVCVLSCDKNEDEICDYCDNFHGETYTRFLRGDVDQSGNVDITDAVNILNYLFQGTEEPLCLDSADADDDEKVGLTDAVYTLNHLFLGGPPLPSVSREFGEQHCRTRFNCDDCGENCDANCDSCDTYWMRWNEILRCDDSDLLNRDSENYQGLTCDSYELPTLSSNPDPCDAFGIDDNYNGRDGASGINCDDLRAEQESLLFIVAESVNTNIQETGDSDKEAIIYINPVRDYNSHHSFYLVEAAHKGNIEGITIEVINDRGISVPIEDLVFGNQIFIQRYPSPDELNYLFLTRSFINGDEFFWNHVSKLKFNDGTYLLAQDEKHKIIFTVFDEKRASSSTYLEFIYHLEHPNEDDENPVLGEGLFIPDGSDIIGVQPGIDQEIGSCSDIELFYNPLFSRDLPFSKSPGYILGSYEGNTYYPEKGYGIMQRLGLPDYSESFLDVPNFYDVGEIKTEIPFSKSFSEELFRTSYSRDYYEGYRNRAGFPAVGFFTQTKATISGNYLLGQLVRSTITDSEGMTYHLTCPNPIYSESNYLEAELPVLFNYIPSQDLDFNTPHAGFCESENEQCENNNYWCSNLPITRSLIEYSFSDLGLERVGDNPRIRSVLFPNFLKTIPRYSGNILAHQNSFTKLIHKDPSYTTTISYEVYDLVFAPGSNVCSCKYRIALTKDSARMIGVPDCQEL